MGTQEKYEKKKITYSWHMTAIIILDGKNCLNIKSLKYYIHYTIYCIYSVPVDACQ